jgi:hypothetical protein
MYNPEKLTTLFMQNTKRRQTKQKLRRWGRRTHQKPTMNPSARAAIIIIIIPVV